MLSKERNQNGWTKKSFSGGYTLEHILGDIYYFDTLGNRHRDDGPAVIRSDGTQEWYQNGLHHRDNGLPAVETNNGNLSWYRNGNLICYYNKFDAEFWAGPPYVTAQEKVDEVEGMGLVFPDSTKERLNAQIKKEKELVGLPRKTIIIKTRMLHRH